MNQKFPAVSVLMSVYDGDRYLRRAIDSILNQTFKNFEFIIVDDGANQRIKGILKEYTDSRLILLENEQNIGLTKSLNRGLKLARGMAIARQDADDISDLNRLETQVEFLKSHQEVGLIGTFFSVIDRKERLLLTVELPTRDRDLRKKLEIENTFCHGSVMFRRECIERVGAYSETLLFAQDYDLWRRMAEVFKLAVVPEVLYQWRLNPKSISISKKVQQDFYTRIIAEKAQQLKIGRDTSRKRIAYKKDVIREYLYWSELFFKAKNYTDGVNLLLKSIWQSPFNLKNWRFFCRILLSICFPKLFSKNRKK